MAGVITLMVATTLAAAAVGFWLSYAGLHVFAARNGLYGPEAWAWPASVDLFILTGELGITVSAIRGEADWLAWVFLTAGFGPSVLFNVLHVAAIAPAWGRYAVAAVPPVAAMLALAALMRQVFKLAVGAHVDAQDGQPVLTQVALDAEQAALNALRATTAAGNGLSQRQLIERFSLTRAQASRVCQAVLAESNGHSSSEVTA
jgi:hypothetical protein